MFIKHFGFNILFNKVYLLLQAILNYRDECLIVNLIYVCHLGLIKFLQIICNFGAFN